MSDPAIAALQSRQIFRHRLRRCDTVFELREKYVGGWMPVRARKYRRSGVSKGAIQALFDVLRGRVGIKYYSGPRECREAGHACA
jgi:hypothetical protein